MENLSCQDILRHYSPFRQGVCQSSTAYVGLLNTAMMPLVLQPEVPSVPLSVLPLPPSVWDDLLTVKAQRPSVFVPVLSPFGSAPSAPHLFLAVLSCPLPSPFLVLFGQCPGAPLFGPASVMTPSSLCAPGRERSDPVSADGVFQEPSHLLTVILCRVNKRR